MALDPKILKVIQTEILDDPQDEGYQGKTPAEIVELLNNPRIVVTPVIYKDPPPPPKDGDVIGETTTIEDSRTAVILVGIPETPNRLTEEDVRNALALS